VISAGMLHCAGLYIRELNGGGEYLEAVPAWCFFKFSHAPGPHSVLWQWVAQHIYLFFMVKFSLKREQV